MLQYLSVLRERAGRDKPPFENLGLLYCVPFQAAIPFTKETSLAASLLSDCLKTCRQQEGTTLPVWDVSLCFPARCNRTGFISSLALLCLIRSVISLAPLCPPDLTADRAQPHIYHQLPALTFNIMELDASPFLEMRSPLPHPVCLPCVGLPLTLLTVIFQTLCLHMVLSAAGRPALHQWSSSSCRSQGAGWIVSAAHTVLPGE